MIVRVTIYDGMDYLVSYTYLFDCGTWTEHKGLKTIIAKSKKGSGGFRSPKKPVILEVETPFSEEES